MTRPKLELLTAQEIREIVAAASRQDQRERVDPGFVGQIKSGGQAAQDGRQMGRRIVLRRA